MTPRLPQPASRRALLRGGARLLLCLPLAWAAGPAGANAERPAAALEAEPLDAELADARRWLPQAREQGRMRLRWFGLAIYDARLFSRERVSAADYPARDFVLSLRYARDFEGAAIAERSIEEMRRLGPIEPAQAQRWQARLRAAFPDVRAGDRLAAWYQRTGDLRFFLNGQPTQVIQDPELAERFLGIWLSGAASDARARQALLGERP